MQVLGNLPFNILVAVLYSGIFYGMCGLRRGPQYFGKFATIVTLLQIIAAQVSSKRLLGWEKGLGTAS
jgi:ABC-type multidrug transport system permease subunit